MESALGALPRLDQINAGTETLLLHLGGDAAKVAMYALPRCLNELPAAAQLDSIEAILKREKSKVTVQKEAIRLLAQFPSDRSVGLLVNFAKRENHSS